MPNRHESVDAPGRGPFVRRFASGLALVLGVLIALMGGERAKADTNSDSIAALRQLVEQQNRKLDELNEKVRLLEEREKQREAAPADQRLPAIVIDTNGIPIAPIAAGSRDMETVGNPAGKPAAQISAGANGFTFQSADSNFVLTLHGVVQADSHTFFKDNPLTQGDDGFLLRRARPILEGTLFRDFDFVLAPDFGYPSVQLFDAYMDYHFRPSPVSRRQVQRTGGAGEFANRRGGSFQRAIPGLRLGSDAQSGSRVVRRGWRGNFGLGRRCL